ncbi:XrtN system VIT domain-containing protein [Pseudoflavitalea sp. G-6-1-2]|uniref:XrtN system VIT domain-containing protein n=1 Tax=Pseudoflavitalea sp. G-6-1-2 TaxID=2728841 RepID=UPI00146D6B2A|nr:XrtN system VIT domain-containing protein [Pseudoflavitalea sp. G-6-1-2]NML20479.1 XrtN system VIT domain-containing protein [Pseudoflavitalea sp. G-6-1-2]
MNFLQRLRSDKLYLTGLGLLAVSVFLALLPETTPGSGFSFFLMSHVAATIYFILIWTLGRLKKGRNGLPLIFVLLVMMLNGCYLLNRDAHLFYESTGWLTVLLVICSINYLLVFFYDLLPRWAQALHFFVIGLSGVLFFYLVMYLLPLHFFSALLCWFLGIPVYTFVPLFFLLFSIRWMVRSNAGLFCRISAGCGMLAAFGFVVAYMICWQVQSNNINNAYNDAGNTDLPEWANAAAKLKPDLFTKKILSADTRYRTIGWEENLNNTFGFAGVRRDPDMRHDPLISIATLAGVRLQPSMEEKRKILQAISDVKLQQEERLWSGDGLFTEDVDTRVQIWPQYRIAYTDQKITIRAGNADSWFNDQREAIYQFYLPEGATVTALSLWIDGVEEPGILTSRSKADSAYTTIVGHERRDPSVLHWQEGNRVSVRVFPVVDGSSRIFRIGYTSPLTRNKNKLSYAAGYFSGPSTRNTTGPVSVEIKGDAKEVETYGGFKKLSKNEYRRSGEYNTAWRLTLQSDEVDTASGFQFNGNNYQVSDYQHQRSAFKPGSIFLDINNSWSEDEYNQLLRMLAAEKVYAFYRNNLVELNKENQQKIFEDLSELQFSLFPFHEIERPDTALVITKSGIHSPNLNEIKGSEFHDALRRFSASGKKIRVFNLGDTLSPYLASLKEYRLFKYDQGSLDDCSLLLARKEFSDDTEDENKIVIDQSGIVITRSQNSTAANAPDHLMRLFVYNQLMHQAGTGLMNGELPADSLVAQAAEAHVVTPVSSLVVLERKADYTRFDIEQSKNALQNAGLNSKGAVPEPHEWALIILAVVILLTLKFGPVWKGRLN